MARGQATWIAARLADLGLRRAGPPSRVTGWSGTRVLRIPSERGDLYFKSAPRRPGSTDEVGLLLALGALFPERVPRALAVDRQRGWVLLEDAGPPIGTAPPAVWNEVFGAFARIQLEAAGHGNALVAAGCWRIEPGAWAERIEPTLEAVARLPGLPAVPRRRWRRLASRLEEAWQELNELALPDTLVHGDLHLANVTAGAPGYVFLDWADACVCHPFLDVAYVFAENLHGAASCREAYLAPWREHEGPERLARMWTVAEPLSALHQVMTYVETARRLTGEARRRAVDGVAFFARCLLASRGLAGTEERALWAVTGPPRPPAAGGTERPRTCAE